MKDEIKDSKLKETDKGKVNAERESFHFDAAPQPMIERIEAYGMILFSRQPQGRAMAPLFLPTILFSELCVCPLSANSPLTARGIVG